MFVGLLGPGLTDAELIEIELRLFVGLKIPGCWASGPKIFHIS